MKQAIAFCLTLCALLALVQCAGTFTSASDRLGERLLEKADSLFHAGDFVNAKVTYSDLKDTYPKSESAEEAIYRLGYMNIYFTNQFAVREDAIKYFQIYQSRYPDGQWIDDVNNWLNFLHTMYSYQGGVSSSNEVIKDLKSSHIEAQEASKELRQKIHQCQRSKDSLRVEIGSLRAKVNQLQKLIEESSR